uniref:Reverse transcriptase domain-containing protein n=1 Tax=Tanacetum cinerariifolium TaxID=118510 RepID=A0A699I3W5_TANCI|nr:hypothetical protein [Tanacetum cinerariifolium]
MPPKRMLISEAPAMTQGAIRQLVIDSVAMALETQAATMANANNANRNPEPREAHVARKCSYKEFMGCQPFNFKGSEGAIGLIHWLKRTESVFSRSNCTEDCKITIAQNKLMEQLTSMCAMVGQLIQKKQEVKQIEEEQAANARYWRIPTCYDDDEDYNSAITLNEPVDSLSMGDEHLNTIPVTKSDKFIKSYVENLVPNPSESEGESECDMPAHKEFTTFVNILFNADYEFDSSDDQSCSDEDVLEKKFSNPLFKEEIIPIKIDQHHDNAESTHDSSLIISSKIDSLLDEFAGELTLLKSIPSFSPSPIPVEDSDPRMEEIDLSFNPDDPMPPGIEEDEDDS